jgi:hypothetical protein
MLLINRYKALVITASLASMHCFATDYTNIPFIDGVVDGGTTRKIIKLCIPDPFRTTDPEKYMWQPMYFSSGYNSAVSNAVLPFKYFYSKLVNGNQNGVGIEKLFDEPYTVDQIESVFTVNYHKYFLGQIEFYFNQNKQEAISNFESIIQAWAKKEFHDHWIEINRKEIGNGTDYVGNLIATDRTFRSCLLRLGSLRLALHSYAFRHESSSPWMKQASLYNETCLDFMQELMKTKVFQSFKDRYDLNANALGTKINLGYTSQSYQNAANDDNRVLSDIDLMSKQHFKLDDQRRLGYNELNQGMCGDEMIKEPTY